MVQKCIMKKTLIFSFKTEDNSAIIQLHILFSSDQCQCCQIDYITEY